MEKLLENKSKARVLAFFFSHPERSFFVGELRKKLGSRKLLADLTFLVKQGVLQTHTKKGSRYYIINSRHAYYPQLKEWVKKFKRKSEDDLHKMLKKIPGLKLAILSGFFTGLNKLQCDLVLVGKMPQRKLDNFINNAERLLRQEINYAVFDFKEFEYRKSTFDRFMKDILENRHVFIVDKTAKAAANKK